MSESVLSETLDLQALFIAEESRMLHFAMHHSNGDFATAQDLVQDAFLRLLTHSESVMQPRAWLFTTIRNLAFNRRRKTARLDYLDPATLTRHGRPGHESCGQETCAAFGRDTRSTDSREVQPADDAALPPDQLEHDEAVLFVRLCMDELPPQDRLLVKLKFEDGLSYAAIAAASGLTPSNVGFWLHTIVKRLAEDYHRVERGGWERGASAPAPLRSSRPPSSATQHQSRTHSEP